MDMPVISDEEFALRLERAQEAVRAEGLDALVVHSNEADFANVRYLSNYWPIFETAGVLILAEREAIQIIGPESETFARDRGQLSQIRRILEYRESAEPDYPGVKLDTFASIFAELDIVPKRIGIAGYSIMPLPIYGALRRDMPDAEIVRADDIIVNLRIIKSDAELACLREAFRISEIALQEVLDQIKPGMTEQQVVAIAQRAMYANGAEYEGHPTYVLGGANSTHAIGRPSPQVLQKGDYVQLSIGARIAGYSSSVGRPICLGKMTDEMHRMTQFGLEAHYKTAEYIKAGIPANEVVNKFTRFVEEGGYGANLLYGPCHGLGMMEVERPWMESHSEYLLQDNMTFQIDTFLQAEDFGLRWENGVRVMPDGVEWFSDARMEIIELGL